MHPANSIRRAVPLAAEATGAPLSSAMDADTLTDTAEANSLAEPSGQLAPLAPAEPELPTRTGSSHEGQSPENPRSADALPGFPPELTAEIDRNFQRLLTTLHTFRPADDLAIVRDAWQFCLQQHRNQKRASGEPYVIHPLEVGQVLAEMKMDSTAIAAGLLHDAVEDTPVTSPEISRRFGPQVAHIVEGVTKLDRIKFANKEDHQAENIRKMLLAMVTDIRVVLIKMADRLHNMRTLGHLRPEKQLKIARETLDIYAPLAHRLGMGKLRGEFEDLAFQYVDAPGYLRLAQDVERLRLAGGEDFLGEIVARLQSELTRHGLPGRVEYRIKRLYSIQQKLAAHLTSGGSDDLAQVHDLYAVRVITQTMQDCYAILGILHSVWRPVPGRIKDFIAMPRPNMYQSLHTTLVAEGGHQFEVQIRTEEMHRIAEDGIAAHWKYKANESVSAKDEQRLAWVRQLMEWQREMTDPNEFMSTLKIDLYPEEVYTFTPKGKVVVLPKDASPIDFAYTIHTEVGHSTVGAKVNGRIVPLRHRLRNGDIVEIATQTGHTPSRDWLTFAKSSRARNKIKHWLNEHQRERAIEIGRKLLEREARKFKVSLNKLNEADYTRTAGEYGLSGESDLLSSVGFGKYSARQVLNRLIPGSTRLAEEATAGTPNVGAPNVGAPPSSTVSSSIKVGSDAQGTPANFNPAKAGLPGNEVGKLTDTARKIYFAKGSESLQVEGQGDLLVYRARCCNPIRGEEIVGYVTRGKGVAVHARTCPNVQNLLYESDRRIQVEWSPTPEDLARQGAEEAARLAKQNGTVAAAGTTPAAETSPTPTTNGRKATKATLNSQLSTSTPGTPRPVRYPVRLVITCDDRAGMLKELTATISDDDTNIRSVDTHTNPDGTTANVEFVIETLDLRHLTKLTTDLKQIEGVREVHRVSKI